MEFKKKGYINKMEDKILNQLQNIFREKLEDETFNIKDNMNLYDIEDYDSFIHFSVILQIEEIFKLRFHTEEIGNLDSVSKIVSAIMEKSAL